MKKNRRIPTVLALLALCAPLGAQNIKQTVEVTNDYLTRFADFQKISPAMGVPDSLYRFDYDFDYSVFETPYKGSYEFSPYRIEVTPEARLRDDRLLYVRAGLGASFHPQLEYAVRLLDNGKHKIGIVGDALGFAGKYRVRDREVKVPGHDLVSRALLNGQYLRPAALLSYSFGYNGILSGEDVTEPVFKAVDAPCPLCGSRVLERTSRKGRRFFGCEKYPDCTFVSWEKPVAEKCPVCGGRMVEKRARDKVYHVCVNETCRHRTEAPQQDE